MGRNPESDRRQSPRIGDDLGVAIDFMYEASRETHHGSTIFHLTRDISSSGMRFETSHPLPLNSLVRVRVALKLPLMTITHFGRVRWVRPNSAETNQSYAVGIQFTDSPDTDMQIWSQYVGQRLEMSVN